MAKKMKMHAEAEKINQRLCDTILENREREISFHEFHFFLSTSLYNEELQYLYIDGVDPSYRICQLSLCSYNKFLS
jgi:hypothetical protein